MSSLNDLDKKMMMTLFVVVVNNSTCLKYSQLF